MHSETDRSASEGRRAAQEEEEEEEGRDGLTKHTRAEWHRGQRESQEQERGTVCAGRTDSRRGGFAEMEKQQVGPCTT